MFKIHLVIQLYKAQYVLTSFSLHLHYIALPPLHCLNISNRTKVGGSFNLRCFPVEVACPTQSALSLIRSVSWLSHLIPRQGDDADQRPSLQPMIESSVFHPAIMNLTSLALTVALLAATSGRCSSSSVPSLILPFTDCIQSRGKDGFYRGAIDTTESGARCINWTEVPGFKERYPGKGIGDHNHCRNPDGRIRPWCFFSNHKGRVDWGYCDCKQGKQTDLHTVFHTLCFRSSPEF